MEIYIHRIKKNKFNKLKTNKIQSLNRIRNHFICSEAKDFLRNSESKRIAAKINPNILLKH